jgi:hypothetical protein
MRTKHYGSYFLHHGSQSEGEYLKHSGPLRCHEKNFLNSWANALRICRYTDLPVHVVWFTEEQWLVNTMFYLTFSDQQPAKLDWSLTCLDTNWRIKSSDQRGESTGVNKKSLCSVNLGLLPIATPKHQKYMEEKCMHQLVARCFGWWLKNTLKRSNRIEICLWGKPSKIRKLSTYFNGYKENAQTKNISTN